MYLVTVVRIKSPPPLLCNLCWPPFLFVEWFSFKLPTITVPPYFNTFKRVQKSHNAGGGGVFKHDAFRNTFQKYGNKKLWFLSFRGVKVSQGVYCMLWSDMFLTMFNLKRGQKSTSCVWFGVSEGLWGLVCPSYRFHTLSRTRREGGGLCPRGGGIKRHVLLSGLFLQRIKTHTPVSHICSWISLFCCCKFYFFSIFESVHLVLTCLCVFYMFVCLCLSILCMLPSICTAIIV